jgi:hypothetical protein
MNGVSNALVAATTGEDGDGVAVPDSATCLKLPNCQELGERPSFQGT